MPETPEPKPALFADNEGIKHLEKELEELIDNKIRFHEREASLWLGRTYRLLGVLLFIIVFADVIVGLARPLFRSPEPIKPTTKTIVISKHHGGRRDSLKSIDTTMTTVSPN